MEPLSSWPSWISARARSHSRLGPEGHMGHLITNALARPFLHLLFPTRRPRRESQLLHGSLSFISRLRSGSMLLADRGYAHQRLCHPKESWVNVPPRSNRREPICFSPHVHRARNLVERSSIRSNSVGGSRRYDKLAANYLAFIQLASIRLRQLHPIVQDVIRDTKSRRRRHRAWCRFV